MPDSIGSLLCCLRRFLRDAEPRTRRSKAQETAVAGDEAKGSIEEADDVAAGIVLGKADEFASERLANEHVLAAPFDDAVGTHTADLMIGVVPGIIEAARHRAGRRAPELDGCHLVERLVRPLLVEVAAEGVEATLLLDGGACRRLR